MCIGIPMQVVETGFGQAVCRNGDAMETIDTVLVQPVVPGDWLMVFLGAAREKISAEYAQQCRDALRALDMAMKGETGFEHLFADLIDREPELPDFLKPKAADAESVAGEQATPEEKH
ncbi:MAG: HypC/HybG/HupF family hydrogenase formation chaperone [Nitratireductor sp.]|nr:HypC/HybG/HupF family hydrogenase formation chaperone [Nitratireductor sp.]MCC0020976.1 HypC/HybG/HupF family hydrogenase formation chaperone [Nitratireductor sp.]